MHICTIEYQHFERRKLLGDQDFVKKIEHFVDCLPINACHMHGMHRPKNISWRNSYGNKSPKSTNFATFSLLTVCRYTIFPRYKLSDMLPFQISCVTAIPELSDSKRFPNYFQFQPSNIEVTPSYLGIIKKFNWKHVGILVQDETLFTRVLYIHYYICALLL